MENPLKMACSSCAVNYAILERTQPEAFCPLTIFSLIFFYLVIGMYELEQLMIKLSAPRSLCLAPKHF